MNILLSGFLLNVKILKNLKDRNFIDNSFYIIEVLTSSNQPRGKTKGVTLTRRRRTIVPLASRGR